MPTGCYEHKKGEDCQNWKGGLIKDAQGYTHRYSPGHPFEDCNHYVREHRMIMEQWLRKNDPEHPSLIEIDGIKYLRNEWVTHHINEIKNDNRIENLNLMTGKEHKSFHLKKLNRKPWTLERRKAVSERNKGATPWNKGLKNHLSDETRKKMSNSQNNRFDKHPVSDETKKKLSLVKSGKNHHYYGKHRSDETKSKISLSVREYYRKKHNEDIDVQKTKD